MTTVSAPRIPEEWAPFVVPITAVRLYPGNAKLHDLPTIKRSLRKRGQYRMAVIQRSTGYVCVGNGMVEAMQAEGWTELAVHYRDLSDTEAKELVLLDNRSAELGGYDSTALLALLQDLPTLDDTGYDTDYLADLLASNDARDHPRGPNLAERFLVPPFTVLDGRQGWWRDRKQDWLSLGLRSEIGRGADLTGLAVAARRKAKYDGSRTPGSDGGGYGGGTSVFDPVLCEIVYRWWCPPGGQVLDPYAGGSVRGIVAARLGRPYLGIDLRPEQVASNEEQRTLLDPADPTPVWVTGDCEEQLTAEVPAGYADLVFTCPPYFDLERYSDDPRDLSTMPPARFAEHYRRHLAVAVERLAEDRFAVVVVGNVRGPGGLLLDLGGLTVDAMAAAGAHLYNDAIFLTPIGSLPIRAGRHFGATRVLERAHQQVLVFIKGDRKRATQACGHLDLSAALATAEDDPEPAPAPAAAAAPRRKEPITVSLPPDTEVTPVELDSVSGVYLKRDDLYLAPGDQPGGKARTCHTLLTQPGVTGCVTAGSRQSPQVNIVAGIAQALGLPCRVHVPSGQLTPELEAAQRTGAEVVQHRPGYNNVIIARARTDARERGWLEVPFGMECAAAVEATAGQAAATWHYGASGHLADVKRLVVPVGSGMSLAGILHGEVTVPILGVVVGADPEARLDRWAPEGWRAQVTLVRSELDYHAHAPVTALGDVPLDPVYEAKCLPYLEPGDLLWVVGRRATLQPATASSTVRET